MGLLENAKVGDCVRLTDHYIPDRGIIYDMGEYFGGIFTIESIGHELLHRGDIITCRLKENDYFWADDAIVELFPKVSIDDIEVGDEVVLKDSYCEEDMHMYAIVSNMPDYFGGTYTVISKNCLRGREVNSVMLDCKDGWRWHADLILKVLKTHSDEAIDFDGDVLDSFLFDFKEAML